MSTAAAVDLERFMGDWYVIAHIPTFIERNAYNAIESYQLEGQDRIATTFSFNDKRFEGKRKQFQPNAVVMPETGNAIWGMQFIWPFRSDYRIAYVDKDYQQTIIAREKRDYAWVMARQPVISPDDYRNLSEQLTSLGYDISKLRRVPQQWNTSPSAP